MGKSKGAFENTKKAQGNARKAEAAAKKRQEEEDRLAAQEAAEWEDGAKKKNSKKESEAEKKAEAARKKAERDRLLKEEEDSVKKAKKVPGKTSTSNAIGLDKYFYTPQNGSEPALVASGIDDALDALAITTGKGAKIDVDKHPERRFKAALLKFEEERLPVLREEHPGLRLNQYKELIVKEFNKSDQNPFNQLTASYNSSREDREAIKSAYKKGTEKRLAVK